MRILIRLSFALLFSISSVMAATPTPDASTLIAKALTHLQKNERAVALKLLESAFNAAQDPETVKEAAVLILQASPEKYSKREAILKYLTSRNRDHPDLWLWYKELGDRAFENADFAAAEEAYLQAQNQSPDPFVIRYKLAWTYWNQKRRNETFLIFVELIEKAHSNPLPENLSLKDQMIRDLAKLWWETGPLPAATFARLIQMPSELSSAILTELVAAFPKDTVVVPPKYVGLLKQIRDQEAAKAQWQQILDQGLYFRKQPCFVIENLLKEGQYASPVSLIACAKSSSHPKAEILARHFDRALASDFEEKDSSEENLVRAYAQVWNEEDKPIEAARTLLLWRGLQKSSPDYRKILCSLLIALPKESFASLAANVPAESWQVLLNEASVADRAGLLAQLQAIDAATWIAYEEKALVEKNQSPSRAFLLKKATWLAENYSSNQPEITKIVEEVLQSPTNPEEKAVKSSLQRLTDRSSSSLEATFSENFATGLGAWVHDLDESMATYQRLSTDWQKLTEPLYRERLTANVQTLLSQIEAVRLPEEDAKLESEFLAKKADLRSQIEKKYEEYLLRPQP